MSNAEQHPVPTRQARNEEAAEVIDALRGLFSESGVTGENARLLEVTTPAVLKYAVELALELGRQGWP